MTILLPAKHFPRYRNTFLQTALLLCCLVCLRDAKAAGDEHWDPRFGLPGVTNAVFGLLADGGTIFAGGFSTVNTSTNSFDRWDGQRWSSMGEFSSSISIVYAAVRQGSNLYVGGIISRINGNTVRGLARWNGTSWSEVGGGVFGAVFALAVNGDDLYVAGSFTNVGGTLATNIARWDGANWHPVGGGIGPYDSSAANAVRRLLFSSGTLYAAGAFANAGPVAVQNVAAWNGSAWSALGSGVAGTVVGLAANGTDIYFGGTFTSAGGTTASNVARWNGSAWSALGSGVNSSVNAVGVLGGRVYVGGAFTNAGSVRAIRVARFDGTNWSALGAGMNDQINEIVSDGSSLVFGGLFTQADDLTVNHVARFDGTNWSALGNSGRDMGSPTFTRSIFAVSNRVYLGGLFTGVGGARASRVAYWNGTNWFPLGSGVKGTNEGTGTAVNTILAVGTNVYVGGSFTNAGGIAANSIARWNGMGWSALGSGVNGSVAAIASVGNDIYVGGNFTTAGGITAFNIARWDGANWSALPPPFVGTINNFFVSALAVNGNDLYIGGSFSAGDGSSNIVRFSNGQWFQLTGNVNDRVSALAVIGTNLFVGGRFTSAGALSVNRIARWNGSGWSALGSGVTGSGTPTVNALAAVGTNLYAGGNFTNAGGVAVGRVAKWNGSAWSALGSGLSMQPGSPNVSGLAASGNDLYVAGTLAGAGGKPASFLAHWNEFVDFDLQPTLQFSQPTKLPGGEFQFRLTAIGVPSYVIEATTNFSSWTPLITNSTSPFMFTDSNAVSRPQRHYRSRSL